MIKREVREQIFNQWLDNKSMREISRSLGIHRNSIKKIIDGFNEIIVKKGLKTKNGIKAKMDQIVGYPCYNTADKRKSKVDRVIKKRVLRLMNSNGWKKGSKGKNAKNITSIYWKLRKERPEGTEILGYTTVCKIVKELQPDKTYTEAEFWALFQKNMHKHK